MNKKSDIVDKNLNFAVGLALFFPVLIESLFGFYGPSNTETHKVILVISITIAIFIINYLLFNWRKNKISDRCLDYIKWLLNLYILSFAIIAFLLGMLGTETILINNWLGSFSLLFAMLGTMVFPVLVLIIIIFNFFNEVLKHK